MGDPKSNFEERRQHKRIDDTFPVLYEVRSPFAVRVSLGVSQVDAIAQDISEGGIGLVSGHEIPPKTLVGLKFKILNDAAITESDRARTFDLGGEVRYCAATPDRAHRLGVLFVSIPDADRRFIAGYIRAQSLKPSE